MDDSLRLQIIPYLKSVGEHFDIPYLFSHLETASSVQRGKFPR